MKTRETLPDEREPYTRGYYAIWGLMSLGAIIYIAFLAFGSGQSSIIKISKVSDRSETAEKVAEQGKRVSTAMTIAARARAKSVSNGKRIASLEKRMQLIVWKMAARKPVAEVSGTKPQMAGDHVRQLVSNDHVKQVTSARDLASAIVGSVRTTQAPAKQLVKKVAAQVTENAARDQISSIAGVIDTPPETDSGIVGKTVEKLSTLNPLKVAAVSAGIAKGADMIASTASKKAGVQTPVTAPAAEKAALKTAAAAAAARVIVPPKPPIGNVPLPVRKSYGVRLVSGRSVESLRLTWSLLNEMNRPILKGLKTRFVEGPSQLGMPYRLIAGPIGSAPQAKQLCAKLHKKNINCDVTVFKGRRL